ncbi:hypothetical protein E2C01_070214 [Portunus trituberculatus]|uniref:Uncharacterized protein n=1 Tax=Portunus trituberculatus TaxID=210409 RepID=A0A5B7I2X2_PORTR|nr:hypothetical protein [Portunus trituberculatus]
MVLRQNKLFRDPRGHEGLRSGQPASQPASQSAPGSSVNGA